ncbi:MAG: hypothetical protein RL653_4137 [Pseudomonadota bacterium]|jgi:serine/threonine-protein kinase
MASSSYELLGPIAPGATRASLALRVDEDTGEVGPVVFVWLPTFALNEEELRTRMIRENERATILEHPNIVRVHGLESHQGRLARVVEYSDGEPLGRVLEAFGGKLPVNMAVRVVLDACEGVHHAHETGYEDGSSMLHGDVRPDTLMVTFGGVTRVGGYGALVLAPKESEGRRRIHAAPEQLLGGREAMTRETDVYLLGLVLYQCLTGKTPWEDAADHERAVLTEPLPFLSPSVVPPQLAQVLDKALSRKALGRFETAYGLRAALEKAWPTASPHASVAKALAGRIPPSDPLRAGRESILQQGTLKRRAAARPPPLPPPAQQPVQPQSQSAGRPAPTGPQQPAASREPQAPVPSHAAPTLLELPAVAEPPARGPRSALKLALGAVTAGAFLAAGLAAWVDPQGPETPARAESPAAAMAPPPAATPAAPQERSSLPAPVAALELDAVPLVPAAPARPQEPTGVDIQVNDELEIYLDGALLGRGKAVAEAPAGRHVLKLTDGRSLVSLRSITVPPSGKAKVRLQLRTGFLVVNAPDGALVQVDGVTIGHSPIRGQVPVLQGGHDLKISLGKAQHERRFTVQPDETVTFNVGGEHP